MPKYMTRQRKILLSYLGSHIDELLSAQEIANALVDDSVSLSAVYRNLADLETEGKVRRTHNGSAREVYYQYIDADECKGNLHLSCKKCGRTFHMDADGAKELLSVVSKTADFAVDKADTVLYGVCGACQK